MPKQNKCISQNVFLFHNCIHGTKYRDVYLVHRNHLSVIHRPNALGVLSPPLIKILVFYNMHPGQKMGWGGLGIGKN